MTDKVSTRTVSAPLAGAGETGEVWELLAAAGWAEHTDANCTTEAVAPTGQVRLVFQPESIEYATTGVLWKVEGVGFPMADNLAVPARPLTWKATFTGAVPAELICAFLGRLVDPAGIDRPVISEEALTQMCATPVPETLLAAQRELQKAGDDSTG
ncbi:DUF317 domain-containing protein [Streptomyces javensis]|uniref:DUF317 domain-containing protein n=1 Tax=Streptomyces javensis TaxID=114698 RepID=A0ABS0R2K3_9ACTN|nr:DUF317 domain-containing protein [Streptomyces javensis]MBI0311613.1 DUF317 domain-containing protein [Streptomyces javensis]